MNATESISTALFEHFGISSDFDGRDICRDIDRLVDGSAVALLAIHTGKGERSVGLEIAVAGIRRGATVTRIVEVVQTEAGELQAAVIHGSVEAYQAGGATDDDVVDYY